MTTVIDWIMKGIMTIACAFVVFIGTKVVDLDKRVTAIESNRFTSNDMLKYIQESDNKNGIRFDSVRADIASLRNIVSTSAKTDDWILDRIKRDDVRTSERLNKLEETVGVIMGMVHNGS